MKTLASILYLKIFNLIYKIKLFEIFNELNFIMIQNKNNKININLNIFYS